HSLAIAHLYRDDYERAGIKLLPTVDRAGGSTGRHCALNSLALLSAGLLPAVLGLTGGVSFIVALLAGGWLAWQAVALAWRDTSERARRLLVASYAYVPLVLVAMALDKAAR